MPNTGRPSQDCHLCRRRRVKCDLSRPGCQRCVKYGVDCPGYRDQHELVFRNANPMAVQKRKKRTSVKIEERERRNTKSSSKPQSSSSSSSRRKSSSSRSRNNSSGPTYRALDPNTSLASTFLRAFPSSPLLSSLSPSPSPSPSLSPSSSSSSDCDASSSLNPLPRPLMEHWTNHSVPIILNIYSTFGFLRQVYQTNTQNGPLIWAAHLFSRTYVTNIRYPVHVCKESTAETQRELGTYMGKTLSAVNEALKEPDGAFRNDVLATVWILANYELLIGSLNRTELSSPWHLHTRGLYSILQIRGVNQLYTAEGRIAFWPCYNLVQIQALFGTTECPPESETWLSVIKNAVHDGEEHNLCVSEYITRCTHILANISRLLRLHDFAAAEEEYESLVQQLEAAEEQVDQHVAERGPIDYTQELAMYMHNMYLSASIKSHSYVLYLADFLMNSPRYERLSQVQLRAQRAHCVRKVRAAAQHIVESNLAALNKLREARDRPPRVLFDALKMVWPLTSVYITAVTTAEQRAQTYSALLFIGKEVGVRQALHALSESGTLPFEARLRLRLASSGDGDDAS
ncbi:hypothetical protein E4U21_004784 [Claviceps maximensis]|nr:hypothetical protein E4U21_004784 [Claviceps maximensis]